MPSRVPGMDPYVEAQQRFHTIHTAFIAACAEVINDGLGPPYYATVEERVLIDMTDPQRAMLPVATSPSSPTWSSPSIRARAAQSVRPGRPSAARSRPSSCRKPNVSADQPTQKLIEIRGRALRPRDHDGGAALAQQQGAGA